MLLVLDNCEHLIEEVASTVSDLISACSRLKILATSRESLRVAGEWLYPVPSFDVPKQVSSVKMETASQFAALALFAERARAVRPDFILSPGNVQTITTICRQLDGLPLAIELMAARMRLMSPQALLERMSNEFILSVDGMRAATTRQKTLNNAIDWSYNLLSPEEQKLFAYLSVFSGGFTLDTAENMFSQIFPAPSVATLITLLLDKSLVQRIVDGEPRFTMLATIQEFSRERLRERHEETDIQNLHLAYFLDLAEQADREIHGPSQTAWMQRLDLELDNFRAALEWSLSSGRTDQLVRLFAALGWTWMVRWSPSESRSWLDKIRTLPDLAEYPLFYVKILNDVIHLEWIAANFDETRSLIEESQAICLKLGKDGEHGLAEVLYLSGLLASQEAQYRRGWSDVEQSFDLYQKYGDSWGMAFARFLLGHLATMMGEDSSGQMYLQQSMDLFQKLEDPWGMARVAQRLGELFLKQGSYEKAGKYFVQHSELDKSLQFKQGIAVALSNLGNLYRLQQDYDQAEGFYRKSLKISDEYNLTIDRGYNWFNLGIMALRRNQYPIAIQFFTDYFKIAREYVEKISTCDFLVASAAVAAGLNQPERAARLYGAAQMLFETTEYRLASFDQAEFQRHIQISRQQLGDAKFESLAAEGRSMTTEQAIAYTFVNNK
jgi:predicted ATPase